MNPLFALMALACAAGIAFAPLYGVFDYTRVPGRPMFQQVTTA